MKEENIKRIQKRINETSKLIAGCSSHRLKTYTINQLKNNPRPNLYKIIKTQEGFMKKYNEKILKLRWELRQQLRINRELLKRW